MSDYWMGVLSVPALILAAGAAFLVAKAVGLVGERLLVGGLIRLTRQASSGRRAASAAVLYGAKRSWMLAGGDAALILVVGMDHEEAALATDRLQPRRSLREMTRTTSARPPIDDSEY